MVTIRKVGWRSYLPKERYVTSASDGIDEITPRIPASDEQLASFQITDDAHADGEKKAINALPPDAASEIRRLDAMREAVLASLPIDQWRFDSVRVGYQTLLKRMGDTPAVETALRDRLSRLTRLEQAAKAAMTIEKTLSESRLRDVQVARVRERLAKRDRAHAHSYSAIGVVQPSSRVVDGHKLHALIGSNGATVAYLDIPPGIDVNSLGARRVGVLGVIHYNQDLNTRLITVRDLEKLGGRR